MCLFSVAGHKHLYVFFLRTHKSVYYLSQNMCFFLNTLILSVYCLAASSLTNLSLSDDCQRSQDRCFNRDEYIFPYRTGNSSVGSGYGGWWLRQFKVIQR